MFGFKKDDPPWEEDAIKEIEDELYPPYFCPEMVELVKSIRNRCDVLLAISGLDDLSTSVPTLIEDLYSDAYDLAEYCIEDE